MTPIRIQAASTMYVKRSLLLQLQKSRVSISQLVNDSPSPPRQDKTTDMASQAQHNFGLIDRTYPTDSVFDPHRIKSQWERFGKWVHHLNNNCQKSENIRYKVLFFGRHGQGYHNVAESFYGTPAWNVSRLFTRLSQNISPGRPLTLAVLCAVLLGRIGRQRRHHLG